MAYDCMLSGVYSSNIFANIGSKLEKSQRTTVKSRKFEVLETKGFISNYQ